MSMQIQRGLVKYKDRSDIICNYGVTDDGKQYYFLDETKLSNGNRIVTTTLLEAVDPLAVATHVGVIDESGNVVIPCENKNIKLISSDILLVETAHPVSNSVLEAIKLRNDPNSAAKLVTTSATIKDNMNNAMGNDGRYVFNDQFSEATIYDINGNNLINNEFYSFVGVDDEKIYFSKNTLDSKVIEYSLYSMNDDNKEEEQPKLNIETTSVTKDSIEKAINEQLSNLSQTIENDASSSDESSSNSVSENVANYASDSIENSEVIPPLVENSEENVTTSDQTYVEESNVDNNEIVNNFETGVTINQGGLQNFEEVTNKEDNNVSDTDNDSDVFNQENNSTNNDNETADFLDKKNLQNLGEEINEESNNSTNYETIDIFNQANVHNLNENVTEVNIPSEENKETYMEESTKEVDALTNEDKSLSEEVAVSNEATNTEGLQEKITEDNDIEETEEEVTDSKEEANVEESQEEVTEGSDLEETGKEIPDTNEENKEKSQEEIVNDINTKVPLKTDSNEESSLDDSQEEVTENNNDETLSETAKTNEESNVEEKNTDAVYSEETIDSENTENEPVYVEDSYNYDYDDGAYNNLLESYDYNNNRNLPAKNIFDSVTVTISNLVELNRNLQAMNDDYEIKLSKCDSSRKKLLELSKSQAREISSLHARIARLESEKANLESQVKALTPSADGDFARVLADAQNILDNTRMRIKGSSK